MEGGGGEQTSLVVQLCFGTILLCCCHGRQRWSPCCRGILCSDQVVIGVIQPHGYPQSWMPYSVERLLEVHEDMVKALLVLQVFLTEVSKIENLLSCAPFCSETCTFFFDDLLSLWLQSVQEDS